MARAYFGNEWYTFFPDGTSVVALTADGQGIVITVEDGGIGDLDGVVNGAVVTTVAPAQPVGGASPNCYGARVVGGNDTKIVGPPGQRGNLQNYFGSTGGRCSGTPRPASQETSFYVIAANDAQALGVGGACTLVAPTGMALPFSTLYFNGPANRYVCLSTPPQP